MRHLTRRRIGYFNSARPEQYSVLEDYDEWYEYYKQVLMEAWWATPEIADCNEFQAWAYAKYGEMSENQIKGAVEEWLNEVNPEDVESFNELVKDEWKRSDSDRSSYPTEITYGGD